MNFKNTDEALQVIQNLRFGLMRIAQCSDYGKNI